MSSTADRISWSEAKRQQLGEQLTGFWAHDEWPMEACPLLEETPPAPQGHRLGVYRFTCLSPALNTELKYACRQKWVTGEWSPLVRDYRGHLQRICGWLNHTAPHAHSLLQMSLEKSVLSLRSYVAERGEWHTQYATWLDRSQQLHQHRHSDPRESIFRSLYATLQEAYDDREEYEKDVWDLRKLGIPVNRSASAYHLNFTRLPQLWLRQAAKQFMRYTLAIHSAGDAQAKLAALTYFAQFLAQQHPLLEPALVDRAVLVEYLGYLSSRGLADSTRRHRLVNLRTFFSVCAREDWTPLTARPLIYPEDLPREANLQPRFIPEDVLEQLNQHLDALPPQLMRMTLVLQECGLRISEVCTLPLNCLLQDTEGDWFLHFYQGKMKKEHSIPVSREGAAVIQEQQHSVREKWGPHAQFLFPNPKGQPYKRRTYIDALNLMAYRHQIRDATGHLYHFTPHQFRHSVGTRMINAGVPHHFVQRYLGHESPEMTARYAHIFDKTMKEEYTRFRSKVVDVTGTVLEQTSPADASELQWMKKNILAQALDDGTCALPLVAGDCPHANACYTCIHFRTDARFLPQHKAHLEATQQLIQVASKNGWQRQKEMNEKVAVNLQRIIVALEDGDEDAEEGSDHDA